MVTACSKQKQLFLHFGPSCLFGGFACCLFPVTSAFVTHSCVVWFHQNPWLGCYGCWLVVWWFGGTSFALVKRPLFLVKGQREKWPLVVGLADHWTSIHADPPPRAHLSPRTPAVVGFPGRRSRTLKPLIKHFMTKKSSTPSCAQESEQAYAQDKTWKGNQLSNWTFLWKYDSKIDGTVSFLKQGLKVLKVTATPPLGDLLEVALIPHQKKHTGTD